MSGHAGTVGPRRGIGRAASTWAGYPAPALVGAVLVQIALHGWAPTAPFAALVVLLVSLVSTRSVHTLVALLGTDAAGGALWWSRSEVLIAVLALAGGVVQPAGAWRHVAAVTRGGGRGDDPAQLAALTPRPAAVWTLSFAAALAACTWWAWTGLAPHLLALL